MLAWLICFFFHLHHIHSTGSILYVLPVKHWSGWLMVHWVTQILNTEKPISDCTWPDSICKASEVVGKVQGRGNIFTGVTDICQRVLMYMRSQQSLTALTSSTNQKVCNAALSSAPAIKEVPLLIHLLYNELTEHAVVVLSDPPCLLWQTNFLLCWGFMQLLQDGKCLMNLVI